VTGPDGSLWYPDALRTGLNKARSRTRNRLDMPFINGIGAPELIIILVIALIVVGPGRLPDVGSALGKSIREFRKAATDVNEATSLETTPSSSASKPQSAPPMAAAAPSAVPPVAAVPPAITPGPGPVTPPDAEPVAQPEPVADEQPTPTA
jgi:TatA/E family protein of Tat protein translocase